MAALAVGVVAVLVVGARDRVISPTAGGQPPELPEQREVVAVAVAAPALAAAIAAHGPRKRHSHCIGACDFVGASGHCNIAAGAHRHREEDRIAWHGIWRRHHGDLVAIEEDAEWLAGDRAFGYRHDGLHGAISRPRGRAVQRRQLSAQRVLTGCRVHPKCSSRAARSSIKPKRRGYPVAS